jgi:hypothetical protein
MAGAQTCTYGQYHRPGRSKYADQKIKLPATLAGDGERRSLYH